MGPLIVQIAAGARSRTRCRPDLTSARYSSTLQSMNDWERFSQYFDKSNNDFLKILKELYPQLTAADLKLCAYLRLNLSTKAIADLLNLSIRGVESSRYRLRKKLSLANDISLFDFLATIGNTVQTGPGSGQLQH